MSLATWLYALPDAERALVDRLRLGQVADGGAAMPALRAETVRQLMFGLLGSGDADGPVTQDLGVRIRRVRITGALDLADLGCQGQRLPALALDGCAIEGDIDLDGARLARLSVSGSRIRKISLRNAEISGGFDFADARPHLRDDGTEAPAWIDARNAVIRGQVSGSGARLRLPVETRETGTIARDGPRYALWLVNAEIHGNVRLRDRFLAEGGVSLDAAHVHGHVRCDGATLTAGEDDAFNAQSAQIGGNLHLCDDCVTGGQVWLLGARIGGFVVLRDATITVERGGAALVMEQADVGASVLLDGARITGGHVSIVGARVRGSVDAKEMKILAQLPVPAAERDEPARAFHGHNADIGQNLMFYGADIAGPVDLMGARIGGTLSFNGAAIARAVDDARGRALFARHLGVGESLTFEGYRGERGAAAERFFAADGMLDLTGARVAGDVSFAGGRIDNRSADSKAAAISGERMQVTGNVTFERSTVLGEVNLAGSTIGRDLKCYRAAFHNAKSDAVYAAEEAGASEDAVTYGSAIYAKDIRIGDDLKLQNTVAEGNLRFERAEIAGSVIWDGLTIAARRHAHHRAPLDLQHARIGSALKAIGLGFDGDKSEIDLIGARVASLVSHWPEGWGGAAQDCNRKRQCYLKLDGFVYERVDLVAGAASVESWALRQYWGLRGRLTFPPRHGRGDALLDWLLLQHPPGGRGEQKDFDPQPFRHLARVLRAQGEEEAARTVTSAEKQAMPMDDWMVGFLYRPFGTLFGFGLSRKRASFTLLVYVLIGTAGVHFAQEHGFLVENAVVASSAFTAADAAHGRTHVFLKAPGSGEVVEELACTDTASNWPTDLVYALDMIVPFIPLHQESKCEVGSGGGLWETVWRIAKAVYSIGGWVIFSLWLVTFSGLLRRGEAGE